MSFMVHCTAFEKVEIFSNEQCQRVKYTGVLQPKTTNYLGACDNTPVFRYSQVISSTQSSRKLKLIIGANFYKRDNFHL